MPSPEGLSLPLPSPQHQGPEVPLHPGSSTHTIFMANGFGPDVKANFFLVSLEEYILTKAPVTAATQKENLLGAACLWPPFSPSQFHAPLPEGQAAVCA